MKEIALKFYDLISEVNNHFKNKKNSRKSKRNPEEDHEFNPYNHKK